MLPGGLCAVALTRIAGAALQLPIPGELVEVATEALVGQDAIEALIELLASHNCRRCIGAGAIFCVVYLCAGVSVSSRGGFMPSFLRRCLYDPHILIALISLNVNRRMAGSPLIPLPLSSRG